MTSAGMTSAGTTSDGMISNGMVSNGMQWDALQREVLVALGHTLYVTTDAPAMRVAGDAVDVQAAGRVQDRNAYDARAPGQATPFRDPASPDALMQALLRAADLGKADAAALQSRLPPLDALAGDAKAKRTLWPSLRAMRARHRT